MNVHKGLILDETAKFHQDTQDGGPFVPGTTEIW